MSYQEITIVGYLGHDPQLRYTPEGVPVTEFSLAANRHYRDGRGQAVKETVWFQVTVWDRQAENASQYLQKGSQVLVKGRLVPDADTGSPRVWQRQDGSPAASYEVVAREIVYLNGGSREEEREAPAASQRPASDEEPRDGEITY
jgi:single-strand DNA-binding protein